MRFARFLLRIAAVAPFVLATPSARAVASGDNVRASQRTDGTGLVDVLYDLSGAEGAVEVLLEISNDGGASFLIVPAPAHLTGDVGADILNGVDRHIVWDIVRDHPETFWPACRARVTVVEPGDATTFVLPGGVILEMVRIPAGTFVMGSEDDPTWSDAPEAPPRSVSLAYDFFLGKFEVTQPQWIAVMGSNPSHCDYGCGDEYPVHTVSWNDIQPFLLALNNAGLGGTFRLPSEAEWERAARAGTTTRFPWGASTCSPWECPIPCDLGSYAHYCGNDDGGAHPFGTKLPNDFGVFDMLGNVWEWVEDDYHGNYLGAPLDGSAWVEEPRSLGRVVRGSFWASAPRECRPAFRSTHATTTANPDLGLRLVWTP